MPVPFLKPRYPTLLGGALALLVASLIGIAMRDASAPNAESESAKLSTAADRIPGPAGVAARQQRPPGDDSPEAVATRTGMERHRVERRARVVEQSLDRRQRNPDEQEDELAMPDWARLISPGGMIKDEVDADGLFGGNGLPDFIDLYNGVEAEFIQENISNGVATDMSALLMGGALSEEVLYNGAVRAEHDLGNAYVLATIGLDGHLRVYAGIERLVSAAGTFIEFEFNQNRVHLSSGSPWPIVGKRRDGDLMIRMIFSDRVLQSVQLEKWRQGGFQFLDSSAGITGDNCLSTRRFMYCVGRPPIRHPAEGFEVWDEDNNLIDPVLADDFVEVGIDVDLLAGPSVEYTSVLFRTPEDFAMNSFRVFDQARFAANAW